MQDEQIAVVEPKGTRFVAYLVGQPRLRGEGATHDEALDNLGIAVHQHLQRTQNRTPRVQNVILHSGRK